MNFVRCGATKRKISQVGISVVLCGGSQPMIREPLGVPHGNYLFSYLKKLQSILIA
jgi:hypothetical protein